MTIVYMESEVGGVSPGPAPLAGQHLRKQEAESEWEERDDWEERE